MYELYIRNMCLNKKRQTIGSKRVRKNITYIFVAKDYLSISYNANLSCLTHGFSDFFPVFLNMRLWEQMTPRTWPIWTSGVWLARFMQGITKH